MVGNSGSEASNNGSERDIPTAADVLGVRAILDNGEEKVMLHFNMLDFEPSPTTVGLICPLDSVRKLVRTCLAALEYFGDQPASVLLKMLNQRSR